MDDVKARRVALGWNRKTLAERSGVDVHVVQLVELGHYSDAEIVARLHAALTEAEGRDNGVEGDSAPAGGAPPASGNGPGSNG